MVRRFEWLLGFAASLACAGCTGETSHENFISFNSFANLSATEYESAVRAAESGNGDAAFVLWRYYAFTKFDHAAAIPWLEKGATNGNTDAQYQLGMTYLHGTPGLIEANPEIAKSWLRRAAEAGDERATEELESLESAEAPNQ